MGMVHSIMVVDDNPDDRELTRCLLEQIDPDLKFVEAESGEDALKLLREASEAPVLVLMDLKMPGLDGVETLGLMMADEGLKRIPVVIASHSALEADRDRAIGAGARGYLHKAFDIGVFDRGLRAELERSLRH